MPKPDFLYLAPRKIYLRSTLRISEIIKTIPKAEMEQLELIGLLHRWYLGDPALATSPLGDAPNERSQIIDSQVRGAIQLSFQESRIGITGPVADRLGITPEPVIDNLEQYGSLVNPINPRAMTLPQVNIGDLVNFVDEYTGPSLVVITYIYTDGGQVRIDYRNVKTKETRASLASAKGLIPMGKGKNNADIWERQCYTILP